jgi:histidinol phosphatase-like PHP family hydrolase
MKFYQDLHVHTYLSACCREKERQTPRAILALAERMNVSTIGFSDHVWANPEIVPSDWYRPQDTSQISRLREDLAGVSTEIDVLVGCEADMIAPGAFGITAEFAQELDFVLLACSHFHMSGFVAQPEGKTPRHLGRHMLDFFLSGVSSGLATSIAHPFYPLGYFDQYDSAIDAISDAEFLDVFGAAAEHDVALEITTAFIPTHSARSFSIETPIRFLSLAKQAGCKFTLGTDAHSPEAQMRLPELVALTKPIGLTGEDIFHARGRGPIRS